MNPFKLTWYWLHGATMMLRLGLIWLLQQVTLFLAPAELSEMIRRAVRKMREEEDQSEESVQYIKRSSTDEMGTARPFPDGLAHSTEEVETHLIIRDTTDGMLSLELKTDPKRRIVERIRAGEEEVVSTPSEAFAMATIRTLIATYHTRIKEVVLPVAGRVVPVVYKGHVIIAGDVDEAKKEIDTIVTSNTEHRERMH